MITGLRAILVLTGVFFIALGASFLIDPVGQGRDFGLEPLGARGLSSMRGDMTAYFWVTGGALVLGGWRQKGDVLLVPVAILGITMAIRGLSAVIDGPYEGWMAPMMVEGFVIIMALFGSRVFPHGALVPDNPPAG